MNDFTLHPYCEALRIAFHERRVLRASNIVSLQFDEQTEIFYDESDQEKLANDEEAVIQILEEGHKEFGIFVQSSSDSLVPTSQWLFNCTPYKVVTTLNDCTEVIQYGWEHKETGYLYDNLVQPTEDSIFPDRKVTHFFFLN